MAVNCGPADLRQLYAETRQAEKRMAVARLEAEQQYEQARQQVAEAAQAQVQAIRRLEQQAVEELESTRNALAARREWEHFQKYAQEVRKMHLGGSTPAVLPLCKRETVADYLHSIQSSKLKFEAILAEFMQQLNAEAHSTRNQLSRELSFNAVTPNSERALGKMRTEPSFEISPIKRRQDLASSNLPEKDNSPHSTHPKALPITNINAKETEIKSRSLLVSDHLPSSRNHLKKSEIKLTSSIFPADHSHAHNHLDFNVLSPSSLRSPPRFQLQQKQATTGQGTATMRSSSKNLSKVKSEPRLQSPGHRGVLQMLQKQQLRFDKLKHGLP